MLLRAANAAGHGNKQLEIALANRNFKSVAINQRPGRHGGSAVKQSGRRLVRLARFRLNFMDRRLKCAAQVLIACLAFAASPARAQTDVFVPSFWDPHHRAPKPEMGDLRSIRFLTEDDYPPFHFALPDGALAGFDVDLARAICEELKIACTIQARRFDTLIDALDENQGDAIIASIRVDDQSRAKLDFTSPYYATPARFVTQKTTQLTDATPESLRRKTIGVEAHSAHEAYLETFFPDAIRKPYDSQKALRDALAKGDIDALFGDGVSLSFWLQGEDAHECCAFRGGPFLDSRFFGEGVGIAVKKGNPHLRQALDYALAALAAKGTYTDLYLKYFPLGFF
jgi:polar amino acid transport system substrate-binding protein